MKLAGNIGQFFKGMGPSGTHHRAASKSDEFTPTDTATLGRPDPNALADWRPQRTKPSLAKTLTRKALLGGAALVGGLIGYGVGLAASGFTGALAASALAMGNLGVFAFTGDGGLRELALEVGVSAVGAALGAAASPVAALGPAALGARAAHNLMDRLLYGSSY